jgi:hypothetical protein
MSTSKEFKESNNSNNSNTSNNYKLADEYEKRKLPIRRTRLEN